MEPNGIENFKPSEKCLQVNNTNKWGPCGSLYMGSARGENILLPKIPLSTYGVIIINMILWHLVSNQTLVRTILHGSANQQFPLLAAHN